MKKGLFLASIFLMSLFSVFAQNKTDLMDDVQKKFESVNDFSADVKQIKDGKSNASGKIMYKKGNKFRLELNKLTLISDGTTAWNYNKKANKVIISDASGDEPSIFNIEDVIKQYPAESSVSINGNIITLTPKADANLDFNNAKLWIDQDDFVKKVEINQPSGVITIELSNVKINQNISDSKFTLTPPEGSKVIDLR